MQKKIFPIVLIIIVVALGISLFSVKYFSSKNYGAQEKPVMPVASPSGNEVSTVSPSSPTATVASNQVSVAKPKPTQTPAAKPASPTTAYVSPAVNSPILPPIPPATTQPAVNSSIPPAPTQPVVYSPTPPIPPPPIPPIPPPPIPPIPPPPPTPPSPPVQTGSNINVCNTSLFEADGLDAFRMIDLATCVKLNTLFSLGNAAGNIGDLYDNRDNLHVNFCQGWTPSPDCPPAYRLFPQHDWKIGGGGAATAPQSQPTLGQASFSGSTSGYIKHGIPFAYYDSQARADIFFNLYIKNNLYMYPSLYEDSFLGSPYDTAMLANPITIDKNTMNMANTPYVVGSKQICKCGAGDFRIHDASGSELPFIELGFAGLAGFKPDVKKLLIEKGMLMPTLQALIRYSHMSVNSDSTYLTSVAHRSMYLAHYLKDGKPMPAFSAGKLVDMANSMTINDIPPLVRMEVISENFTGSEKLFTTQGAIARSVSYATPARSITVSAASSNDIDGATSGHEYRWVLLSGDSSAANISVNPQNSGQATIEFSPGSSTERIDVGVFVKKLGGLYYSVPGIISQYVHP